MPTDRKRIRSNGKLLLTGEYVVLDGALALAVPTTYGQSLDVEPIADSRLIWTSYDEQGHIWFENIFNIKGSRVFPAISVKSSVETEQHNKISTRLIQILNAAKRLNPEFLIAGNGYKVITHLDFPKSWGLGTSSTLINNLAQWAVVDAYDLLGLSFGGSGYDIACAQNDMPISYQLTNVTKGSSDPKSILGDRKRVVAPVDFNPVFKEHLYFVYLNKKQNSRDGIAHYRSLNTNDLSPIISEINAITQRIVLTESMDDFQNLIDRHEAIISKLIKQNTVKSTFFEDFNGTVKSLGAWGGDFILVCSKTNPTSYFNNKGFDTVIPYGEMVMPIGAF